METHSAWYLIPPKDQPHVNWDAFPEDIEFCDPDEQGFRGFIVEFYNIVSGRWVRYTGFSVVTAMLLTQTRALS